MAKIIGELHEALNETTALPFLFIGSGFSRRYLGLPDWKGLMTTLAQTAHPEGSEFAYQHYRNLLKGNNIPQDELLPLIASEIEKDYTTKVLNSPEFDFFRTKYGELILKETSCLKIGVSDIMDDIKSVFDTPYHPEEIASLRAIKSKVAGVITTNFDTFIEYIFDDFETYIGQDSLLFSNLTELAEIYKIHGCCTDPESLVLTSADYHEFSRKNAYLSAKLLTIFIEHPIVFMGYSLNDQNIRSILYDILQCLNEKQIKKLANRLFFVLRASEERSEGVILREKEFNGKAFEITEIIRSDFGEIYETIGRATPKYSPKILSALKKDIYELVTNNDPKGKLLVLDIEDTENLENVEYVLGVGAKQLFGDAGYSGLEAKDLFEDLLYDDRNFNPDKIVTMTLPKLLKTHANSVPVFKYVSSCGVNLPRRVEKYVEQSSTFDSHLNKTIRDRLPLPEHSVTDVKIKYHLSDSVDASKCLYDTVSLEETDLNKDELKALLIEIYSLHPKIFQPETNQNFKSLFRKTLKIYDWLVYCTHKK